MKPKKIFFTAVGVVWLLFLSSTQAVHAISLYDNTNGAQCRAANLNQAQKLAWSHARVYNPGNTALWVICTPPNDVRVVWDGDSTNDIWWKQTGVVYAWFDTTAANDAEVRCIWRDLNSTTTGNAPAASVSQTIANPGSAPAVDSATFDLAGAAFNPLYSTSHTVTCKLDPGTGINAIQAIPAPTT